MAHLELIHSRSSTSTPPPPAMSDTDAAAAARAIVQLFNRWELSSEDSCTLLGEVSQRTWSRWKKGDPPKLDRDLCSRLSYLLGIHKALRSIFNEPERGYRWIRAENEIFGGKSALDVMRNGDMTDLMRIRSYLDAERSAW